MGTGKETSGKASTQDRVPKAQHQFFKMRNSALVHLRPQHKTDQTTNFRTFFYSLILYTLDSEKGTLPIHAGMK